MGVTPLARGLYICERVIVAPGTRNLTLENCFRGMRVHQFPARRSRSTPSPTW
jgi:hypothetical protein